MPTKRQHHHRIDLMEEVEDVIAASVAENRHLADMELLIAAIRAGTMELTPAVAVSLEDALAAAKSENALRARLAQNLRSRV